MGGELMSAIEAQIIPRLMLAHGAMQEQPANDTGARLSLSAEEVARCADVAVQQDMNALMRQLEGLAAEGVPVTSLLLDLLAPTARLLGDQWLQDERSFFDVTVGLGMLQRAVAALGRQSMPPVGHRGLIVLLAAPGEQHTLGIHVLGEILRNEGWAAHVEPGLDAGSLVDMVASEHVAMVGISVSHAGLIDSLSSLVHDVRRASLNPSLGVLVGGCAELETSAAELGALYCASPADALSWLERNVPAPHVET
ncbi:MAG: hypothetical protein AAGH15_10485 [Myxococcota bacterium]